MEIDLSFLASGIWNAELFGDEPDNAAAFKCESKPVNCIDTLTISMSPRGEAVIWITKFDNSARQRTN